MERKKINFKPIALSLIFLFNPNISIIDPLPDFIGYILLSLALVRLADMNDTLGDALALFKRLVFVDAAKVLAIFWTFGISVTTERNTSLLLWSFVFALVEIIFVTQAFSKLFSGISSLATICESSVVQRGGRRSYTDKIKRFTIIFISVKAILSVLPEFSVLSNSGYNENYGVMNIYRFIGVMRMLAFLPVFILGVVWLVRAIAYFIRVNNDTAFVRGLGDVYAVRVLTKESIFIKRNVRICFTLAIAALALNLDFRIDSVNMLPDVLAAVCIIAFFAVAAKRINFPHVAFIAVSIVYAIVSAAAWWLEYSFFKEYYYEAIYRSDEALFAYIRTSVAAGACSVLFFVLCVFMVYVMYKTIKEHTGLEKSVDIYNDEKYREMDTAIKRELSLKLIYCVFASLLVVASNVCYLIFSADYGFLMMVDLVVGAIAAATYAKVYFDIDDAVDSRYLLE